MPATYPFGLESSRDIAFFPTSILCDTHVTWNAPHTLNPLFINDFLCDGHVISDT